jgi:predicted MFS family arabinose efflux permease
MSPFLLIIIGAISIALTFWYKNVPASRKRKAKFTLIVSTVFGLLVILTVTGRLPWFFALVLGIVPFLGKWGWLISKLLPMLNTKQNSNKNSASDNRLTRQEALAILGLNHEASEAEIRDAHKRIIQKVHPDHGGSDLLASQVNAARDRLLEKD